MNISLINLKKKKKQELFFLLEKLNCNKQFLISFLTKSKIIALVCYFYLKLKKVLYSSGYVEILPSGFAFLRSSAHSFLPNPDDIFITPQQVKKFFLRYGDFVICSINLPTNFCRYFSLCNVLQLNTVSYSTIKGKRISFSNLIAVHPHVQMKLEFFHRDNNKVCYTARIIDLISPIGFGQRVLLVSPPKSGKTLILQNIVISINLNYKHVKVLMLLIDERPEEVTEMRRIVSGVVVASTFDESPLRHIHVANMVLEHAKRIVEISGDVVILLDSITRLARAFNNVIPTSGKILTGGIDSTSLQKPKRFFGAARFVKNGGSLTIVATALVETGSKMDDIIFEEFKGTGNSEIFLERSMAEKKIFPAINILRSGTRRDDLLVRNIMLYKIWELRKLLQQMSYESSMEFFLDQLKKFSTNEEFLQTIF